MLIWFLTKVRFALENNEGRFELINFFDQYASFRRGICEKPDDEKKHIDYCVRLNLEDNSTNGFFIAVFQKCILDSEITNSE